MRGKKETYMEAHIASGNPKELPKDMATGEAVAYNQNNLAMERTEFAKIRTDLALTNSMLAADRTHLSYLRTIVSLLGSAATIYKALPMIGVSETFSVGLALFLLAAAGYFIYKDAATYPKLKKRLKEMERRASELAENTENHVYILDADFEGTEEFGAEE